MVREKLLCLSYVMRRAYDGFVKQIEDMRKITKPMSLFKILSESEELEFRQWARDNYTPLDPIKGIWHPIVQDECTQMNRFYTVQNQRNDEKNN